MAASWLLNSLSIADPDLWSPEAESHIRRFCRTYSSDYPIAPPALGYLNVTNGILAWAAGLDNPLTFAEHTPQWRTIHQLPIAYNPSAECPQLRAFQARMLPEASPDFLAEVFAWCLAPVNPRQKALYFYGAGGSGKSTLLKILQTALGSANVVNDSLHTLLSKQFALERIWGKLAVLCPDISKDQLPAIDIFKRLVGDDAITAERKFERRFEFHSSAKLIISGNGPPHADGADSAFWRRWHIIPMNNVMTHSTERLHITDLLALLTSPAELSGLLNWALAVAPRVWRHGITETEEQSQLVRTLAYATSPAEQWAHDCTFRAAHCELTISAAMNSFTLWCRQHGVTAHARAAASPLELLTAVSTTLGLDRPAGVTLTGAGLRIEQFTSFTGLEDSLPPVQ